MPEIVMACSLEVGDFLPEHLATPVRRIEQVGAYLHLFTDDGDTVLALGDSVPVIRRDRGPHVEPMLFQHAWDGTRTTMCQHVTYHPHEGTVVAVTHEHGCLFLVADRVSVDTNGDLHVEYAS